MYNLLCIFNRSLQLVSVTSSLSAPKNKKWDVEEGDLQTQASKKIMPASQATMTTFYQEIIMAEKKPTMLKIIHPYAQEFIPKLCSSTLPLPMLELYNPEALHMNYLSLLEACELAFQSITV